MNKLGHWGIILFIFGFVVFGLVARERMRGAKIITVTGLFIGVLPDIDLRIAQIAHRGVTHTMSAALIAGIALAVVAFSFEPLSLTGKAEETFYGFITGFVAVGCHLVGDVITPMGIKPLYPILGQSYTLDIVSAHNQSANLLLLVVGILTFQMTVRHARMSDPVPTHSTGFHRADFGLDAETEADIDA
ncbi:metal-dependent hydrolase [Haladaptatus cibarius]|uniref:metal-dependent hydrolase n=1 Tax=Haladaptatus cibarius TaxID=453847 RepID=UPI000679D967|nr:metal-dependent hydrolase [Haladaptatus cibarius]